MIGKCTARCQFRKISGADPGFLPREAPASETESCWCSKAELPQWSNLSRARALEALLLKFAFSGILETVFISFLTFVVGFQDFFLSFLTASWKPIIDKKYYLAHFANQRVVISMKKSCLWSWYFRRYAKQSKARNCDDISSEKWSNIKDMKCLTGNTFSQT